MFSWNDVRSVESEKLLSYIKIQNYPLTCNHREFIRERAVETVGLKRTGNRCLGGGSRGNCR